MMIDTTIETIRALNDLPAETPVGGVVPENPEYLRGQVDLAVSLFSDGDPDVVRAEICRRLGVNEDEL